MMTEINITFDKPIDLLTYQLKQQFYDMSENELKLIAILYLKGLNKDIKKDIIRHNIFKSPQSVENHLTKLRKKGILNENNIIQLKHELSIKKRTEIKINLILGENKGDK